MNPDIHHNHLADGSALTQTRAVASATTDWFGVQAFLPGWEYQDASGPVTAFSYVNTASTTFVPSGLNANESSWYGPDGGGNGAFSFQKTTTAGFSTGFYPTVQAIKLGWYLIEESFYFYGLDSSVASYQVYNRTYADGVNLVPQTYTASNSQGVKRTSQHLITSLPSGDPDWMGENLSIFGTSPYPYPGATPAPHFYLSPYTSGVVCGWNFAASFIG